MNEWRSDLLVRGTAKCLNHDVFVMLFVENEENLESQDFRIEAKISFLELGQSDFAPHLFASRACFKKRGLELRMRQILFRHA